MSCVRGDGLRSVDFRAYFRGADAVSDLDVICLEVSVMFSSANHRDLVRGQICMDFL